LTLECAPRLSVEDMSATASPTAAWTVTELARRAGTTADTVRYYERAGLLPPPRRSPAGYRHFDELALDRLRFIHGAQRLGLRLREIRDLLTVRDTGTCPCEPAERMLRRHLTEVDLEIARLSALRVELVRMVDQIRGPDCPDPVPGTWRPPVTGDDRPEGGEVDDNEHGRGVRVLR
jgi:DNA-binding transcriptional MerR regulator